LIIIGIIIVIVDICYYLSYLIIITHDRLIY